jgi:hypothetical protein
MGLVGVVEYLHHVQAFLEALTFMNYCLQEWDLQRGEVGNLIKRRKFRAHFLAKSIPVLSI